MCVRERGCVYACTCVCREWELAAWLYVLTLWIFVLLYAINVCTWMYDNSMHTNFLPCTVLWGHACVEMRCRRVIYYGLFLTNACSSKHSVTIPGCPSFMCYCTQGQYQKHYFWTCVLYLLLLYTLYFAWNDFTVTCVCYLTCARFELVNSPERGLLLVLAFNKY